MGPLVNPWPLVRALTQHGRSILRRVPLLIHTMFDWFGVVDSGKVVFDPIELVFADSFKRRMDLVAHRLDPVAHRIQEHGPKHAPRPE